MIRSVAITVLALSAASATGGGVREVCLCPHVPIHVIKGTVAANQAHGLETLTMSGRRDVWEEYIEATLDHDHEFEGLVTFAVPHDVNAHAVTRIETRVNFRGEKGRARRDQWELQVSPVAAHPASYEEIWDNMRVREWIWSYSKRAVNLHEPLSAYLKSDGTFDVRVLAALNNVEPALFDFIEVCLFEQLPPTPRPSQNPTSRPTMRPTKEPTNFPTRAPVTPRPSKAPVPKPTPHPTTARPTLPPPTARPTVGETHTEPPTNEATPPPTHEVTDPPTVTDPPVASGSCYEPVSLSAVKGEIGGGQTVDGLKTLDQTGETQIYDKFVTFLPTATGGQWVIAFHVGTGAPQGVAQATWNYIGQTPAFQTWKVEIYNFGRAAWELVAANPDTVTGWGSWSEVTASLALGQANKDDYVNNSGDARLRYSTDTNFDASALDFLQLCLLPGH